LELAVKANDAAESGHNYFDRLRDQVAADFKADHFNRSPEMRYRSSPTISNISPAPVRWIQLRPEKFFCDRRFTSFCC